MKCHKCKTEIKDNVKNCPKCGSSIIDDEIGFNDDFLLGLDQLTSNQSERKTKEELLKLFEYEEHSDGTYTIVGLKDKNVFNYNVPESVSSIAKNAFEGSKAIKVVLPEGLVEIESYAFKDCKNLQEINLPSSLMFIGDGVFENCELLDIEIPSSVVKKGKDILKGTLAEIRIKQEQERKAKEEAAKKAEIERLRKQEEERKRKELEAKLKIFNYNILKNGDAEIIGIVDLEVENILIPDRVVKIENGIFDSCPLLVSIDVEDNNPNYISINGNLYSKDKKTLIQYAIGKKNEMFLMPNTVEVVCKKAFANCKYLKKIQLSNNLTNIDDYAFYNCSNLEIDIKSSIKKGTDVIKGTITYARLEKERIAREEAERKVEAERIKREKERIAREEAERIKREKERIAREEAERKAREEAERIKKEKERIAREEQERQIRLENERIDREISDNFSKAQNGDINAQLYIAKCYFEGFHTQQSYSMAKMWCEKAASKGSAEAMSKLGDIHYYGLGVDVNIKKAEKYYKLAIKNGAK